MLEAEFWGLVGGRERRSERVVALCKMRNGPSVRDDVDDTPLHVEMRKLDVYSLYASFPLFYILYDKSCMMAAH